MINKYTNLVITEDGRYIDGYSYNRHIIELTDNVIKLNTSYFNYSSTTSRHFTKYFKKVITEDVTTLQKTLLGYHAIKRYIQITYKGYTLNTEPNLLYKLKSFINKLGYDFTTDRLGCIWLVIPLTV